MNNEVTETLIELDLDDYDGVSLNRFIETLQDIAKRHPEHSDIRMDTRGNWEELVSLEFIGTRPETEQETKKRLELEKRQRLAKERQLRNLEEQERNQYLKLKAKYGKEETS